MTTFSTNLDQASLQQLHASLKKEFDLLKSAKLDLDLTRGKPNAEQLNLSDKLDGILGGNFVSPSGVDTRNYGGLDGIPEAKAFFAPILQVKPEEVLIGGNSSLTLMYDTNQLIRNNSHR